MKFVLAQVSFKNMVVLQFQIQKNYVGRNLMVYLQDECRVVP